MSLETLKTKVGKLIEKAQSGGNTDELEAIIDNSGVLDNTEGTVTEKVEQLVAKSADENIWYSWISGSKFADLFYGFKGTKLPRLNYESCTSLYRCFYGVRNIERFDFYINCPNCTNVLNAFGETSIKYLQGVNTSAVTNASGFFQNSGIQIIEEPFDFSNVTNTNNAFARSWSLIEIRFVAETIKVSITFGSSNLSAESIQSIIDGLATVETAQTLTLHADVKTKLTQTQLDTITGKNWSLA